VFAVDEFCGCGFGAILPVGNAAGVAESRFASEGNIFETVTVSAVIKSIAFGNIPAFQSLFDLGKNHGTDIRMREAKIVPMIFENLFYGKLGRHSASPEYIVKSGTTGCKKNAARRLKICTA
jgi:hypothetical protein